MISHHTHLTVIDKIFQMILVHPGQDLHIGQSIILNDPMRQFLILFLTIADEQKLILLPQILHGLDHLSGSTGHIATCCRNDTELLFCKEFLALLFHLTSSFFRRVCQTTNIFIVERTLLQPEHLHHKLCAKCIGCDDHI